MGLLFLFFYYEALLCFFFFGKFDCLVENIFKKNNSWVQIHSKEPMWLLNKRIVSPFLVLSIFSYEMFFEQNLLQLVIKNTYNFLTISYFLISHCWINFNFSKSINFVKFCVSCWKIIIISNHTKICYLF
jgi:hypothetical protein